MQGSKRSLSKCDAISLLEQRCCDHVVKHSLFVSHEAKKTAEKIKQNGYDIDVDFVEIAALIHDIGRCKTHSIRHGVEGAKIIKRYSDKLARVCETHIGAGLTKEEAISLGLPAKDYLPETLEEKVIAHADNLAAGAKLMTISEALEELREKLGENHPAIGRVKELNDFIEELCTNSNRK